MSVTAALQQRTSVRAFLPDPVSKKKLTELLNRASLSPSASNTQPWHLAIVSGEARQRLEKTVFEEVANGMEPHRELSHRGTKIDEIYKARMVDCGMRYYDALGVQRHEKERRKEIAMRNWKFFDAPHVGFLSINRSLGQSSLVDLGIFLQSFMLLLTEAGLASCPQGDLASYPSIVRKFAAIPEDNAIACGLSFGYEDKSNAVNQLKMPRASLEEIVSFVE